MRPFHPLSVFAVLAVAACHDATSASDQATQLVFTTQPASDTVGSIPVVAVTAETADGAAVTGFTGTVVLTLGTNPGGAVLSGTTSVAAINGVASFPNLAIDKAKVGYTLTATAGTLTGASTPFDISEMVTSQALRYYYGLDLETGASVGCDIDPCPPEDDFNFAYYSPSAPHAYFVTSASRTIATLTGRSFASVHLADTTGASFSGTGGTEFLSTNTFLIRTTSGNVYKLGDPTEFGTGGADSVRFHVARLN